VAKATLLGVVSLTDSLLFGVQELGLSVRGLGLGILGPGFRDLGLGFRVSSLRVWGQHFRV
jgi:hypothetical protein